MLAIVVTIRIVLSTFSRPSVHLSLKPKPITAALNVPKAKTIVL